MRRKSLETTFYGENHIFISKIRKLFKSIYYTSQHIYISITHKSILYLHKYVVPLYIFRGKPTTLFLSCPWYKKITQFDLTFSWVFYLEIKMIQYIHEVNFVGKSH